MGSDDVEFFAAVGSAFWTNFVSEFGDKTFCICAVMATTHSRHWAVFFGVLASQILMTLLSGILGANLHYLMPANVMALLAAVLLALCGCQMLWTVYAGTVDDDEFEDATRDVRNKGKMVSAFNTFTTVFLMTFFAEWGDRSQIATFILGSREALLPVFIGGSLGQAVSIALAVVGGSKLAHLISPQFVTLLGGLSFICMAVLPVLF